MSGQTESDDLSAEAATKERATVMGPTVRDDATPSVRMEPTIRDGSTSGERAGLETTLAVDDRSLGSDPTERTTLGAGARKEEARTFDAREPFPRFEDFVILSLLGKGAFAKVYLARQIALDRLVALKVSADLGQEARTMARLEHDHIVQVFSETVDPPQRLRLICMRYVPGTTLEKVIEALRRKGRNEWSGRILLETIDALSSRPGEFDPTSFRDREFLGQADWVETVCWIGARLAEALAHAHGLGVLHRDIKPANILINTYGRPLLTDFNLASSPHREPGGSDGPFGGTLGTMAPEHLDALNPEDPTPSSAVDERSDLYSLGVVIYELLTGRRPFAFTPTHVKRSETLRAMAADRRSGATSIRRVLPAVPEVVNRVILRCLEPDPARRYPSATELARALDGCCELRRIERALPPANPITRAAIRGPFAALIVFTFAPHLLGSLINISYNAVEILGGLSGPQMRVFSWLVLGYNAVIYPLCLGLTFRLLAPPYRAWRAIRDAAPIDNAQLTEARRRVLAWPMQAVWLSCLGWLPGGLIFPTVLWLSSPGDEPIVGGIFNRFLISFWFSGLIALTYAYFGAQFVALRVLYPKLWVDPQGILPSARRELASVEGRLRVFQCLAGLIPLVSAALLIGLGPEHMSRGFRVLATGLIVLGMAGISLTLTLARTLSEILAVMTGAGHRRRDN
jgi:serine/threonine protein kinase